MQLLYYGIDLTAGQAGHHLLTVLRSDSEQAKYIKPIGLLSKRLLILSVFIKNRLIL